MQGYLNHFLGNMDIANSREVDVLIIISIICSLGFFPFCQNGRKSSCFCFTSCTIQLDVLVLITCYCLTISRIIIVASFFCILVTNEVEGNTCLNTLRLFEEHGSLVPVMIILFFPLISYFRYSSVLLFLNFIK